MSDIEVVVVFGLGLVIGGLFYRYAMGVVAEWMEDSRSRGAGR